MFEFRLQVQKKLQIVLEAPDRNFEWLPLPNISARYQTIYPGYSDEKETRLTLSGNLDLFQKRDFLELDFYIGKPVRLV